jgi:hypothetical protein
VEGNPSALKWYDIIGHWKRRHETAKVKKRFKKRSGYVIRRRASEPADQVDSGLNPFHIENFINAHSVSGQEINCRNDHDDLCLLRIQGWMENCTSSKNLGTMTGDSSIDENSNSKSNCDADELSEDDDFQKVRLQKWMMNGITHKTLGMTTADIHKKYTIDIMSGASDESD